MTEPKTVAVAPKEVVPGMATVALVPVALAVALVVAVAVALVAARLARPQPA